MMEPTITVVTLTRGRVPLLHRAIEAVANQTISQRVRHLIIIDDCRETAEALAHVSEERIEIIYAHRSETDATGPARAAALRNKAIARVSTEWICFLDDDNQIAPYHLIELLSIAEKAGVDAVHSLRQILHADGTPYLDELDPWQPAVAKSRASYLALVDRGLFTPGSNVIHDSAIDDRIKSVDTGEWLIRTRLMQDVKFREMYSTDDEIELMTEDDGLLQDLRARNTAIVCNGIPSLFYYIGGYSTDSQSSDWSALKAASDL